MDNAQQMATRSPAADRSVPNAWQPGPQRRVMPCDFRQAAQMTRDQLRAVTLLHERFANNVASALGAYLRVAADMQFRSAEQMLYGDYVHHIVHPTYLVSLLIQPFEVDALLHMDLDLVFPMIDLVLGGPGQAELERRPITEIEAEVMADVVRIIGRQLEEAWRPVLELEIHTDGHQLTAPAAGLMLATEKVLVLGFELSVGEARGKLRLVFPAVMSNALLRKLAVQLTYLRSSSVSVNRDRMRTRLLGCRFVVELRVPPSPVRVAELLALTPGSVLALQRRVAEPVELTIAGQPLFLASPVSCGRQRGARIVDFLPGPEANKEHAQ
jgi:flagellar motor switch protein FliM